jgi:hypothetical protein
MVHVGHQYIQHLLPTGGSWVCATTALYTDYPIGITVSRARREYTLYLYLPVPPRRLVEVPHLPLS